jgi:23S rRNA G2069 N7-methylase RlmK/C1962 C5-methylase RlmI
VINRADIFWHIVGPRPVAGQDREWTFKQKQALEQNEVANRLAEEWKRREKK